MTDQWKLVPVEPTEEMMNAGVYQSSHDSTSSDVHSIWKDMVAFAPTRTQGADDAQPVAMLWPVPIEMNQGHVLAHAVELRFESEEDSAEFVRFACQAGSAGSGPACPSACRTATSADACWRP